MTKRLLLAGLLAAQTMASMDGSIANVALPSIQRDLGATGAVQQLVVSGYLLMLASLIVAGARLGDLVGHRRAFQWGLALFTAASLACGLAWSPMALVGARAIQGAGAALLVPQVFSLIQLHFRGAARRRAVGLYSMVLALGVALALGGAGHAAGYGPLIARLSDLVPPGRASAFSALNSTGPLLGQTVAVAVIGGVYLRAGLTWALGTIAAVLVAGAVCAAASGRAIGSARAGSPGRPVPGAAVAARWGGGERSTSN